MHTVRSFQQGAPVYTRLRLGLAIVDYNAMTALRAGVVRGWFARETYPAHTYDGE